MKYRFTSLCEKKGVDTLGTNTNPKNVFTFGKMCFQRRLIFTLFYNSAPEEGLKVN